MSEKPVSTIDTVMEVLLDLVSSCPEFRIGSEILGHALVVETQDHQTFNILVHALGEIR